jgi:hypothetical protein
MSHERRAGSSKWTDYECDLSAKPPARATGGWHRIGLGTLASARADARQWNAYRKAGGPAFDSSKLTRSRSRTSSSSGVIETNVSIALGGMLLTATLNRYLAT